jgi:hypothetical protein
VQGGAGVTDDGVAYLDVKQQLLLSYCINIAFYMLLKVRGWGHDVCRCLGCYSLTRTLDQPGGG